MTHSGADYDRALALTPHDAGLHTVAAFTRAGIRLQRLLIQRRSQQEPVTAEELAAIKAQTFQVMLDPETVNGLVAASRLSRHQPFAIGMAVFFEIEAAMSK